MDQASLARRIEGSLIDGTLAIIDILNRLDPAVKRAARTIGGGVAIAGGPGSPLSLVVGLGLHRPFTEEDMDAIETFDETYDAGLTIRTTPFSQDRVERLASERGYRLEERIAVWYLSLTDWRSAWDRPDERVRPAGTDEEAMWAMVVEQGFRNRTDRLPDADLLLSRAFFRMAGGVPVIAEVEGQPAGGGMLAVSGQESALFAGSVHPAFRGRRLQPALIDWRLRLAQKQGCRWATVETVPDSISARNVEQSGFRLVYHAALWRKPSSSDSRK